MRAVDSCGHKEMVIIWLVGAPPGQQSSPGECPVGLGVSPPAVHRAGVLLSNLKLFPSALTLI